MLGTFWTTMVNPTSFSLLASRHDCPLPDQRKFDNIQQHYQIFQLRSNTTINSILGTFDANRTTTNYCQRLWGQSIFDPTRMNVFLGTQLPHEPSQPVDVQRLTPAGWHQQGFLCNTHRHTPDDQIHHRAIRQSAPFLSIGTCRWWCCEPPTLFDQRRSHAREINFNLPPYWFMAGGPVIHALRLGNISVVVCI